MTQLYGPYSWGPWYGTEQLVAATQNVAAGGYVNLRQPGFSPKGNTLYTLQFYGDAGGSGSLIIKGQGVKSTKQSFDSPSVNDVNQLAVVPITETRTFGVGEFANFGTWNYFKTVESIQVVGAGIVGMTVGLGFSGIIGPIQILDTNRTVFNTSLQFNFFSFDNAGEPVNSNPTSSLEAYLFQSIYKTEVPNIFGGLEHTLPASFNTLTTLNTEPFVYVAYGSNPIVTTSLIQLTTPVRTLFIRLQDKAQTTTRNICTVGVIQQGIT